MTLELKAAPLLTFSHHSYPEEMEMMFLTSDAQFSHQIENALFDVSQRRGRKGFPAGAEWQTLQPRRAPSSLVVF